MPTALTAIPEAPEPPRKRWTRYEYENLTCEVLGAESLELVEGDLINKLGKSRGHVNAAIRLQHWLQQVFGTLRVEFTAPIDVAPEDNPRNEPAPDLIVTRGEVSDYASNPQPADLLLVVEVADTTLAFDLTTKARLYARAGIADYWVVDVAARRLIVQRDPADGHYLSVIAYGEDERVTALATPDSELAVSGIFTVR